MKKIILERWKSYLTEVNPCHKSSNGRFSSCDKGSVYSLTKKGARDNNIDPKYVQRGVVVSKEDDMPPKLKSKYGINTSRSKSAGRKTIDGEDIDPKYSVSKYPERYEEAEDRTNNTDWRSQKKIKSDRSYGKPNRKNHFHGYEEMSWLSRGLGHGVLENLSVEQISNAIASAFIIEEIVAEVDRGMMTAKCRKLGLISIAEAQKRILASLNAFSLAQSGKLNDHD